MAKAKRAIGVARVSQMRGREDASLPDQRERIEQAAKAEGLRLVDIFEEPDVSGGADLDRRTGLGPAVAAIESGEADVIVAAYFDRFFRNLRVQDEVVSRVEAAGGQVLAVDVGRLTNGSAAQWLSSTLLGAVAEHQRRVTAERVGDAQRRAIARGVAPWRHTTPGYARNQDGVFEPHDTAPAVAKAFDMRGEGKSARECREHLLKHGIKRTPAAVGRLFHDRAVLGELHFGDLHNLDAHPPIVTAEQFKRAQTASAPRGRQSKSQLLLARLGVLRCASCNSRLVAGQSNNGTTPTYRCRNVDCTGKVVISARIADEVVTEYVRSQIADVEGRASAEGLAMNAIAKRDDAQERLDAAIRALADLTAEPAAVETIGKLRDERDAAQEEVDRLGGESVVERVRGATDWGKLSLTERRDLIKLHAPTVAVRPGRGRDRVKIETLGE